jgi:hypothetical protein
VSYAIVAVSKRIADVTSHECEDTTKSKIAEQVFIKMEYQSKGNVRHFEGVSESDVLVQERLSVLSQV